MIISKTPFRISFFGGGTDYRHFFAEYGGKVLTTSIDKYCYVTVSPMPPFFEHKNQITYSKVEKTQTVDEIEHALVRETLKFLQLDRLRILYDADLPARTGLGTSSAFTVGLLHSCYQLKRQKISKEMLAKDAIYVERTLCNEAGGEQDQVIVAHGGLNTLHFSSEDIRVEPLLITPERKELLQENLMLFFTGISRNSYDIAVLQSKKVKENVGYLRDLSALVDEGVEILQSDRDILEFGRLLGQGWKLKKQLARTISTQKIDEDYSLAISCGAVGGKLLGAGGGGFMLVFAPPEAQAAILQKLDHLLHVPFRFEDEGSTILYHYSG